MKRFSLNIRDFIIPLLIMDIIRRLTVA